MSFQFDLCALIEMSLNTLKVIVRVRPSPLANKSSEKHTISDTRICLRIPDSSDNDDAGGSTVNTIYIDRDKKGKSDFRFSEGAVLSSTSADDRFNLLRSWPNSASSILSEDFWGGSLLG